MPLDANLYNALGTPLKSFNQYANELGANALQQAQVNELPLRDQLLRLQLSQQNIANQMAGQKISMLARFSGQMQGAAQNPAFAALSAGANQGSVGPTVANAQLISGMQQPGQAGVGNRLAGIPIDDMAAYAANGIVNEPTLKLYDDAKYGRVLPYGYRQNANGTVSHFGDPKTGLQVNPDGSVSTMPGAPEANGAMAGAVKGGELRATNENTLAPVDRINPATNQPYAMTVADLIKQVSPNGGSQAGAPFPAANPLDSVPPQQRALVQADMKRTGLSPADATVNGQPMQPNPAAVQQQLDAAKSGGREGIARYMAQTLPTILAIQDPAQRDRALQVFQSNLQTPAGTPISAGQAPAQSAAPQPQGFAGFQGPAQMAASKLTAEQQVKGATQPAIDFATDRAKSAATYGDALNTRVTTGQDLMMRVAEQQKALQDFKPGMGSEAKLNLARFAEAVGAPDSLVKRINGGDIAAKQEFMKLSAQTAMESLKQAMGGSGRITQAEFKVFQQNNPNIELDPDAINKIYNFATKVYQRDLSEQQSRTKYLKEGGDPAEWLPSWAKQSDPLGSGKITTPGTSGFHYIGPVSK